MKKKSLFESQINLRIVFIDEPLNLKIDLSLSKKLNYINLYMYMYICISTYKNKNNMFIFNLRLVRSLVPSCLFKVNQVKLRVCSYT